MKRLLVVNILCFFLMFFCSGCLGVGTETAASINEKKCIPTTELEGLLDKYTRKLNFSGSVLVADNSGILIEKGYGLAYSDRGIKNNPNTVFNIASLTKQFTAASILLLEERGYLRTTDTLKFYIPDYPNGDKITIHNLLTHTSGITEYVKADNISCADHYFSPMDIIDSFKNKPLEFEPGSRYKYCNSNYILLGYIIEKASGCKYEDFVRDNIFTPLEMTNSDYDHNEAARNKAIGYNYTDGTFKRTDYFDMSFAYSAGALQSTVEDLYKWDQALYTEKLIKKDSLNKMFTPYIDNYGYGWIINGPNTMYHSGSIVGFSTIIYRDTLLDRCIIILANESGYNTEQMLKDIVKVLNSSK